MFVAIFSIHRCPTSLAAHPNNNCTSDEDWASCVMGWRIYKELIEKVSRRQFVAGDGDGGEGDVEKFFSFKKIMLIYLLKFNLYLVINFINYQFYWCLKNLIIAF